METKLSQKQRQYNDLLRNLLFRTGYVVKTTEDVVGAKKDLQERLDDVLGAGVVQARGTQSECWLKFTFDNEEVITNMFKWNGEEA